MRYLYFIVVIFGCGCGRTFVDRTAKYALVSELVYNRAAVYDASAGGWGYVDSTGLLAIECRFAGAASFSEGLAVVRVEDRCGYIDTEGRQVITPRYSAAEGFVNGYARVQQNGLWGIISRTGTQVAPCIYADMGELRSNGWIAVTMDNLRGFISAQGVEITPCVYDMVGDTNPQGLTPVMQRGLYGLLDQLGGEAQPCRFAYISPFREGRARINFGGTPQSSGEPDGGLWGIIDTTGRAMLRSQYYAIDNYAEGRAAFQSGEYSRMGYLDLWGHIAIEPAYGVAFPFREGVAVVSRNNIDFGLIDLSGDVRCDFRYKFIGTFVDGLAPALTATGSIDDDRWGYIDRDGRTAIPFVFHEARPFREGLARVYVRDEGYGFIDREGQLVVPCEYDSAAEYENGVVWVTLGDERLLLDGSGRRIEG